MAKNRVVPSPSEPLVPAVEVSPLAEYEAGSDTAAPVAEVEAEEEEVVEVKVNRGPDTLVRIIANETIIPPPVIGKFDWSRNFKTGFQKGVKYMVPRYVADALVESRAAYILE